ncbi:hypothetical protein CMI47_12295 [Candidatus Pacearchaeota archaeon]|jgi:hypothetical protein|nr:hypothetical protein [Candidatus Pacearchaeota archaeon]
MADDQIPEEVDATIDASLGDAKPSRRRKRRDPAYRVVGDSKIPVSKATGKVWKSRVAQGQVHTKDVREAWSEAIRYFENDQLPHREGQENASGNTRGNRKLNDNITETENVVFANVTTMVPALYARNPRAEFTSNVEARKPLATILERLVNVLGARKAAPGINMKPKAKRAVVTCLLTNRAWVKIGWTNKAESSEQALIDLGKLSKELEKAKDAKKIVEIEGKLQALEESIDILQPSGPFAKVKTPFEIIVDPNAKEIDLSDANWVIEEDMLPTEYILAKYAKKGRSSKEYKSIFQPSHVMKATLEGDEGVENADNFSIFSEDKDSTAKSFGFADEESFNKAKMTKVYIVWDKVTRRVLMFNSKDWTWPIWVWDDPLSLDTYFPFFPLTFFESPNGPLTKGEVTYYLDQQDAINEITDEDRRARRWARRNIFYNSNVISQEDATAVLNGDDGTARGLNVPTDIKLNDVIASIVPPSLQFEKIFDKEAKYRAIDRISSVGAVLRGEQFKTNTNKAAVQANTQSANMRVDEKSDQIEDWIGAIYWGVTQLCLMNMSRDDVISLIGEEGEQWENMERAEISQLSMQVVGGSTKKPTSAAKKEEALELGQVLGQFVNAAPGPVLKVMLEVMQEAFDEITMREEDWQELIDAVMQQAGAEQTTPGDGAQGGLEVANASPEQLKQLLAQLPPEVKQEVQAAIQSGVPPQQALQAALAQQPQGGNGSASPQGAPPQTPPVAQ